MKIEGASVSIVLCYNRLKNNCQWKNIAQSNIDFLLIYQNDSILTLDLSLEIDVLLHNIWLCLQLVFWFMILDLKMIHIPHYSTLFCTSKVNKYQSYVLPDIVYRRGIIFVASKFKQHWDWLFCCWQCQ